MRATASIARLAARGLAAALLLAAPAIVQAKAGCELVDAMLARKTARLAGIGMRVNADGTVDATYNGKPGVLRGAGGCEIDGPVDGFQLRCDWDFAAGEDDKAARVFAALVKRVDACLPQPLDVLTPKAYSEAEIKELGADMGASFEAYLRSVRSVAKHEGHYPVDATGENTLDITLDLDRDARDGTLTIHAGFERF